MVVGELGGATGGGAARPECRRALGYFRTLRGAGSSQLAAPRCSRRRRRPPPSPASFLRVAASLQSLQPARDALGLPGQCPPCGSAVMATKIDKEACREAYNLVRDDGSAVIW